MLPRWCQHEPGACQRHEKSMKIHKVPFGRVSLKRTRGFFEVFVAPRAISVTPRGAKNRQKIEKSVPKVDFFEDVMLDHTFHRF